MVVFDGCADEVDDIMEMIVENQPQACTEEQINGQLFTGLREKFQDIVSKSGSMEIIVV